MRWGSVWGTCRHQKGTTAAALFLSLWAKGENFSGEGMKLNTILLLRWAFVVCKTTGMLRRDCFFRAHPCTWAHTREWQCSCLKEPGRGALSLCPMTMHLGGGLPSMSVGSVVGAPEQRESQLSLWKGPGLGGGVSPAAAAALEEWPSNRGQLGLAVATGKGRRGDPI